MNLLTQLSDTSRKAPRMSAGTDHAITELQHAVRELAARVDSIEQARNSTAAAGKFTLTARELTALPVGSVVEEADSGRRWRRDDDGLWYRLRDGVAANEGGLYSYELVVVGDHHKRSEP